MLDSCGWRNVHLDYTTQVAQIASVAALTLFCSNRGHYIPITLKLFEAEIMVQLLYIVQMTLIPTEFQHSNFNDFESNFAQM